MTLAYLEIWVLIGLLLEPVAENLDRLVLAGFVLARRLYDRASRN